MDTSYPDLSNLTTKKLPHKNLVLDGACSNCACCGQDLSDAVSIQRGIGPKCSQKGYLEEEVEGDLFEAYVVLSGFPELYRFLKDHYEPLGLRGLINGLVRTASLNRPRGRGQKDGNLEVFRACCDAVEAVGHKKMAALLRNTLVAVWLDPVELGIYRLRVRKGKSPDWLGAEIHRTVSFCRFHPWKKGEPEHWNIGLYEDETEQVPILSRVVLDDDGAPRIVVDAVTRSLVGEHLSNKRVLWAILLKAFPGLAMKIGGERTVPIRGEKPGAGSD